MLHEFIISYGYDGYTRTSYPCILCDLPSEPYLDCQTSIAKVHPAHFSNGDISKPPHHSYCCQATSPQLCFNAAPVVLT